jgi:hypothetical protein
MSLLGQTKLLAVFTKYKFELKFILLISRRRNIMDRAGRWSYPTKHFRRTTATR